jgi:hypothetical protein
MQNGKLRLNVEELSVESFSPAPRPEQRGTVKGAGATEDYNTLCAATVCEHSYCVDNTSYNTQCNNHSCGCQGGGSVGGYTCDVRCHATDPIE